MSTAQPVRWFEWVAPPQSWFVSGDLKPLLITIGLSCDTQGPVPLCFLYAVAATAENGKDRTYNLAVLIANQSAAKS